MSSHRIASKRIALVALAAIPCFFAGGADLPTLSTFGPRDADAVIGRPLTPLSYAGVARRTTRRAVYAGAAMGATTYAPYAPAPACVQGFDAYGRMYYSCP
jgi:hypothetical protein